MEFIHLVLVVVNGEQRVPFITKGRAEATAEFKQQLRNHGLLVPDGDCNLNTVCVNKHPSITISVWFNEIAKEVRCGA